MYCSLEMPFSFDVLSSDFPQIEKFRMMLIMERIGQEKAEGRPKKQRSGPIIGRKKGVSSLVLAKF